MADNSSTNVLNSFIALLTVLFIGLKLTNNIDWSWLWVLSPLWIPVAFVLLIMFITVIVFRIKASSEEDYIKELKDYYDKE